VVVQELLDARGELGRLTVENSYFEMAPAMFDSIGCLSLRCVNPILSTIVHHAEGFRRRMKIANHSFDIERDAITAAQEREQSFTTEPRLRDHDAGDNCSDCATSILLQNMQQGLIQI
jgi:hypothetical protein